MPTIFVGQPFTLSLETYTDLADVDTARIAYRKPQTGEEGLVNGSVAGTVLTASVTGSVNDEAGLWYFHAYPTFSGDASATPGERVDLEIKDLYEL